MVRMLPRERGRGTQQRGAWYGGNKEGVENLLRGAVVLGFKGKRLRGLRVGAELGRVEVLGEILILHLDTIR